MKILSLAIIVLGISTTTAFSQQILKQEPRSMRTGEKVLVDNGRCVKGQVQEVTGGRRPSGRVGNRAAFAAGTNVNAGGQRRQRRCVARS
jgi:hypothetical protein